MFTQTHVGTLDPAALLAAFERVYANYVVPVHATAEWLQGHLDHNDVVREDSPLWVDGAGDVAALGLLGVRGSRGWIGGFGVAPDHRGQGLSRSLARDMLERAARRDLSQVQLEVIAANTLAIRTYRSAGFTTRRDLIVYVRPGDAPALRADASAVRDADADVVLGAAVDARGEHALPGACWQREPASMLGRGGLRALTIGEGPDAGFLLYGSGPSGVRLAGLSASGDDQVGALMAGLVARVPGLPCSVLNEPDDSPYRGALESLGFVERLRQHEMVVKIEA